MKVLALCLQISLLLAVSSDAFNVQPGKNRNHAAVAMSMTEEVRYGNISRRAFGGTFGAATFASFLFGDVEGASAFAPRK